MKTSHIIAIFSVIGAFALVETWLFQHREDPTIHIKDPAPVATQTSASTDSAINEPADTDPAKVEPKVPDEDIPHPGDRVLALGKLPNEATVYVDVTSGNYDDKTHQSTFLVIEKMDKPVDDGHGGQITDMVQRDKIDCVRHQIAIEAVTLASGDQITEHYAVKADVWHPIPQVERGVKTAPIMTLLERLVCPDQITARL